jgi:hypothetical protein
LFSICRLQCLPCFGPPLATCFNVTDKQSRSARNGEGNQGTALASGSITAPCGACACEPDVIKAVLAASGTANKPKITSSDSSSSAVALISGPPGTKLSHYAFDDASGQYRGAPLPQVEASRMEFLCGLNVLDTPPDPKFDEITRLCLAVFKVRLQLFRPLQGGHAGQGHYDLFQ